MQPSRVLLIILMLLTALGETSTQLLIPALGELERGLDAEPGSRLLALSLFVGAFGLGQLLLGFLQDGSVWPMVALSALFAVLAFLFFHLLRLRPAVTAAVAGKLP